LGKTFRQKLSGVIPMATLKTICFDCRVHAWNLRIASPLTSTALRSWHLSTRERAVGIQRYLTTIGSAALLASALSLPAAAELARATLKDGSGKAVGEVDLSQTPSGVLLRVSVKDLSPGEHAFHIHEVGRCEPPFASAGGHFNPGHYPHGYLSGEGHAGDMPNLYVPQNGTLAVDVMNSKVTLEKGKPNSLFGNNGTSIVIHAKADDYKSQPAGAAGDRIACGVILENGNGNSPKK
jgi:Cu-Zn family superoxide dismutase